MLMVKKKWMLASAASFVFSMSANALPEFSGSLELDIDATQLDSVDEGSRTIYDENGFVELNAYSKRENGQYFVVGKGGIRLTTDGDDNVVVRDSYIQFGTSAWDLQIGRFEAINLFPLGKDTVVANADAAVYEANLVRGFVGNDGGQIVLHVNASENVLFELDTLFGDDDASGDDETAFAGIRPSLTFGGDNFSITAGMEYVNYDLSAGGEIDKTGLAITGTFNIGTASVNLAAAKLEDDSTTGDTADDEVTSFTANVTAGNFGAGLILSETDVADTELTTVYAAYTFPLFGVEDATFTIAGSYSEADNVPDNLNNEVTAIRGRFNYTF